MNENFAGLKITRVCSITHLTTSGAPIDDRTVASCAPFMFRKSHVTAPLNSGPIFNESKTELGAFTPNRNMKVNLVEKIAFLHVTSYMHISCTVTDSFSYYLLSI